MTPLAAAKKFICTDCPAEFSRKDHAKRHKLSHERPEFACPHANCGLLFHRRDVLRRHEAVHRPENAERRRRPRRGPLPLALPRSERRQRQRPLPPSESRGTQSAPVAECNSTREHNGFNALDGQMNSSREWDNSHEGDEEEDDEDDVDPACLCHVHNGTVCVPCSSELIRLAEGRIPAESQEAIKFCMTHYIQSQLKWFPFILPSSLRMGWLHTGRALILAALGARGIKEYKTLSAELWGEAVRRVEPRVFSSASGAGLLRNFQTKILIVEYLQWSEDNRFPLWARPMLEEMAHREAYDLMDMLIDVSRESAADASVEYELRREEIRWTLWKFYCAMTRATLLDIKLHPPRLFQTLELPGSPNEILALSRCSDGGDSTDFVGSVYHGCGLTLPQVLSALIADDHSRIALPDMLSMTGQDIVLHAILYLSDNMVESPTDDEVTGRDPLGWRVETRERLYLLVVRWRQCFWVPPEVLWAAPFPEFGRLQSIMFIVYLAVRISQPIRDAMGGLHRQRYAHYAMRCIATIHMNMKNNSLIEIAAKGRWFFDGAAARSGGLTAKYTVEWFRDRAIFGFGDEDIEFLQDLESVMAHYSYVGSYSGVSYSPTRLAQLERSVQHLWTTILGTDTWLSGHSEGILLSGRS
ncbi:putative zinc finger C2H2-type protein [Rosellinia necatrix]|uniref:Putative zinc finger C2H2-type protein n=1 Tax=Rosellinia necatrix TaxID=77044 RepID=A0A1W2TKI6_ROSNE|nr:putative zinc finger C2H2-type protein [Rosellinia necatrix]